MNDLLPFSHLTDTELLGRVYLSPDMPALVLELAARLQHALDELSDNPPDLEAVLARHERGTLDGDDTGG